MTKAKKIEISQEELKEVLDYNPDTGVFRWKIYRASNAKVGDVAGCIHKVNGYHEIGYNYQVYKAHRLAWIYAYGSIPEYIQIDHIDGNRANNRISNLRPCSNAENQKNRKIGKDNTSGYKGVSWNTRLGKWVVNVGLNNKRIYLGGYVDKAEAITVHKTFCEEHHGKFYRDTTL